MTIQDATAPLRRVCVRRPVAEDLASWRAYGWRSEPDPVAALDEHDALCAALADAGADVVIAEAPVPGDPDAIYAYDPVLVTDAGIVVLRPGKPGRRGEPEPLAADLEAQGLRVIGRLRDPATAEGGDMFFVDPATLFVGLGYRTNEEGVRQLRALLEPTGISIVTFDLPHRNGPDECLHLLSIISPLAPDLAVVYLPLMPVRLVQQLQERGVGFVEVPDDEFDPMGPNVLALGPRVALVLEGNPETQRRLETAGVDVRSYRGEEISRKGDGGPTCLTRPLDRG